MPTPKFSNDPEQDAEMRAQWHFENRILGINPYRDEPEDDFDDFDAPDFEEEEEEDDTLDYDGGDD